MANEEKIIDKIKALFNKAESCKNLGSLHEAEAFLAKAQELLLQYNIDMARLMERTESVDNNGVAHVLFETGDTQAGDRWLHDLLKVVAKANGCRVYRVVAPKRKPAGPGMRYVYTPAMRGRKTGVYGRKQALEMLTLLYDYLAANLTVMSRTAYSSESKERLKRERTTRFSYLQSYLLGATKALMLRVEKSQQQNVIGTNALILYNEAAVTAYGEEVLGTYNIKVKGVATKSSAFDRGFNEGTAMPLQQQTHIQ